MSDGKGGRQQSKKEWFAARHPGGKIEGIEGKGKEGCHYCSLGLDYWVFVKLTSL